MPHESGQCLQIQIRKRSCFTNTLVIFSRSCHSRGAFVYRPTSSLYSSGASLGNSTLLRNPLSTFAEVCFTYLNFRHIPVPSPTVRWVPSEMPPPEYAPLFLLFYKQDRLLDMAFTGGRIPRFTELRRNAYLGIIGIVSTVLEVKERNVNEMNCMALDNRISYSLRLNRRVGCVTHQRDFITHRYLYCFLSSSFSFSSPILSLPQSSNQTWSYRRIPSLFILATLLFIHLVLVLLFCGVLKYSTGHSLQAIR